MIEDDVETAELLANCVGNADYVVDIAADVEPRAPSIGRNR